MCDLFDSGPSDQELLMQQQLIAANKANAAALKEQKIANDQAKAAADGESESARLASEERMRKILAAGPFGAVLPTGFDAPTVGTRALYGG